MLKDDVVVDIDDDDNNDDDDNEKWINNSSDEETRHRHGKVQTTKQNAVNNDFDCCLSGAFCVQQSLDIRDLTRKIN